PSHGIDTPEKLLGLSFYLIGEPLDKPGPAEWVDRVADAGLEPKHLLGAEGDLGRPLARQGQRLVERVRVQRLGAAENGGERLVGGADDVVLRLLGGERRPAGLGVEG